MAPVPREHQRDHGQAQRDEAVSGFYGELVLHDQRYHTGDYQQASEPAKPTPTVMVMAAMHVVMVMAVAVTAAPSAAFITAFIQREFVAHRDINFTHSVSIESGKIPGGQNWLLERTSSWNHQMSIFYHQIIIIFS